LFEDYIGDSNDLLEKYFRTIFMLAKSCYIHITDLYYLNDLRKGDTRTEKDFN